MFVMLDIQIRGKIFLEISQFQNFHNFPLNNKFQIIRSCNMIRHIFTYKANTTIHSVYTDQSRTINFSSQHFFISLLKFSFAVVKPTRIKGAKLFIRGRGYNRLPDPLSHQCATSRETISRRKRRWDNVFPLNPSLVLSLELELHLAITRTKGEKTFPSSAIGLDLRRTDNQWHFPFENNVSKCKATRNGLRFIVRLFIIYTFI